MIKNVIGAFVGAKLAERSPNVSSTGGAAGGALAASVVPFVISRLSLPLILVVGAGAYLLSRNKAAESAPDAQTGSQKPDSPEPSFLDNEGIGTADTPEFR